MQAGAVALIGAPLGAGRAIASPRAQSGGPSVPPPSSVKALVFDTFGTVVDWRSSVAREVDALAKRKGAAVDGAKFADAWRAGYGPSMNRVRSGELPWTRLDALHRMILDTLLADYKITGLTEDEKDALNRAWHRLTPWPDAVAGLTRLKKKFIIAPLSNGNISLMTDLAKHSALPWDAILGAELVRHYKPDREVYQSAADLLDKLRHESHYVWGETGRAAHRVRGPAEGVRARGQAGSEGGRHRRSVSDRFQRSRAAARSVV